MDADHLSKRLAAVAAYVPVNSRMADIGSDHAYLPVYLAKRQQISYAVAGEVVDGPFENAKTEIANQNLTERIDARLGDGVTVLKPDDNIDTIVIAGMGGTLISDILERGWQQLTGNELLVLQPNVGEYHLRKWLAAHAYQITAEQILKDDGHIYEIMVAHKVKEPFSLNELDARFGHFLLAKPNAAFVEKWQHEQQRNAHVLASLNHAANVPVAKQQELQHEQQLIEEVLQDASTNLN
ncbi:MAG: tRNA (adenine(22)-N(1))-methyltransferase TrmK [Furfurilactobacillus sp.]|jgi:tRNA (adenine22-N1)-methyltransferase|uniref:tRNA (Adenine(22)-N(1))-methyltransferase TrmK n=1 Tax=Furfurilactobacillus milii TaxID=2888272 RepID=A0ABT6DC55_9LACO|nr:MULTISPECIES: tRNA (adenine(22)-N(1))-methyltransferase TrmK [Furfurilactobacillus]QLE66495.1 tRNA-m1A22 methylase [Furfurilactobacillus rossiae]MCF6159949.1 tRNA (adenine(22)-N(1))-methyltransferase TrmK [Furfurilactobacillus milii]MCF6162502.1 tRNA (adenine(22)-N(1))-methyltransferase TrmK [Furfurilactobacillus milii]MCF6419327.1 tRNA (adenine(22)-N(1))-methyltransferase TrmK [Furfurilactobacillus milii]MCH4010797.1 tRNA (adenine(22)-N(1))-methyltransferase TrmK [Furfurilactobacillus sp.]